MNDRCSNPRAAGSNGLCHNGARSNYHIVTYRQAWEDDRLGANQRVLPDLDPAAQYGTWRNVAPRPNVAIMVDHRIVIDNNTVSERGSGRNNGPRRNETASTECGVRSDICTWVSYSCSFRSKSDGIYKKARARLAAAYCNMYACVCDVVRKFRSNKFVPHEERLLRV